jgi:uncharacterized protein (TIGR02285 family)
LLYILRETGVGKTFFLKYINIILLITYYMILRLFLIYLLSIYSKYGIFQMFFKIVFLLLPAFLFANQPVIDWYRINFPPSLIYKPSESIDNSGYSDRARTFAINNMNNYKHQYLPVSIKRVMTLAKNSKKKTICFSGINKNAERKKFLTYSKPHLLSLPNQLVVRKNNNKIKKLINSKGRISLKKFLDSGLTLSIAKSRAYSPNIDKIIKEYQKDIITPLSTDISHSYMNQVINSRADATIDYPVNINYLSKTNSIKNNDLLTTYPIEEDYKKLKVYFACSKSSSHSQNIIRQINTIIDKNEKLFTTYYTDYLTKEQKNTYEK